MMTETANFSVSKELFSRIIIHKIFWIHNNIVYMCVDIFGTLNFPPSISPDSRLWSRNFEIPISEKCQNIQKFILDQKCFSE